MARSEQGSGRWVQRPSLSKATPAGQGVGARRKAKGSTEGGADQGAEVAKMWLAWVFML